MNLFSCLHTLVCWLAQVDSNHRPRAYQARALTTWAMSHYRGRPRSRDSPSFFSFRSSCARNCCLLFGSFASACLSGGGDDGIRTHDPLLAGQVLSQLSYTPICFTNDEWCRFAMKRMLSHSWSFLGICFFLQKILQNWTTNRFTQTKPSFYVAYTL